MRALELSGGQLARVGVEEAERLMRRAREPDLILTGIPRLDRMLALEAGNMIVVAGRPGTGKSTLALNIAVSNATRGQAVGFLTLEMTAGKLGLRALCAMARVSTAPLMTGAGGWVERDQARMVTASGELSRLPIWIDECSGISLGALLIKCGNMVRRHNLRLLVIDYLQLIVAPQTESREQGVAEVSRSIKRLAMRHQLPVIVAAQLNRRSEGKRPSKGDLRESGSIEQDADVILLLHEEKEESFILVAKNREGATGDVPVTFHRCWSLFEAASDIPADHDIL
jgi:replicative DNA helicase